MIRCEGCGKGIEPRHPRGRFCSGRCRTLTWKKGREAAARAPLERSLVSLAARLEELAQEAREALAGKE